MEAAPVVHAVLGAAGVVAADDAEGVGLAVHGAEVPLLAVLAAGLLDGGLGGVDAFPGRGVGEVEGAGFAEPDQAPVREVGAVGGDGDLVPVAGAGGVEGAVGVRERVGVGGRGAGRAGGEDGCREAQREDRCGEEFRDLRHGSVHDAPVRVGQ